MTEPVFPQQPFTLAQMSPPPKRRRWLIPLLVALVLVLAAATTAGVLYAAGQLGTSVPEERGAPKRQLIPACQEAVRERLKAPSTAKFSDEREMDTGNQFYSIGGVVDSQNGFGAMVRNRYRCTAERGDAAWTVHRVEFSDWP